MKKTNEHTYDSILKKLHKISAKSKRPLVIEILLKYFYKRFVSKLFFFAANGNNNIIGKLR